VIIYSKHAREQMIERGIHVHEVEKAITQGAKEFQAPNQVLHHFRHYTVVTRRVKHDIVVITVMLR
jgi:hypothetical protein